MIFGLDEVKKILESEYHLFIIERCERHDHACMGMTEGAMIGTEAGDMLTACCKEPTHHLAIA